jgi:hypothetical protein
MKSILLESKGHPLHMRELPEPRPGLMELAIIAFQARRICAITLVSRATLWTSDSRNTSHALRTWNPRDSP